MLNSCLLLKLKSITFSLKKIATVIITNNEEANIRRTLEAIQQVTSEILVVDSMSTDNTVAICEKKGVPVIRREWEGYAKTKNFANNQVEADWILSIDADEVLSDELIQSLRQLEPQDGRVYALDRINNFCGQWIKHSGWYPDWKVRLFNKNSCYWVGNYVHEKLKYPSNTIVQKLEGKLYHYSYNTLEEHRERIERYAQLSAEEMYHNEKRKGRFQMALSAAARFFRTYILKAAFLDGKNGWIISCRNAQLVWLKYKKLRQLNNNRL